MKNMGLEPSQIISLELSDLRVYERLENRWYDPLQGVTYDCLENPPQDQDIVDRLIQSPEDKHHVVKQWLEKYKLFINEIEDNYGDKIIRINADRSSDEIFNSICECFI